jgi:hypothetical protein
MSKAEDSRLKMLKILQTLNDICSIKQVKLPKNIGFLFRKLYKYTKSHTNMLKIGFYNSQTSSKTCSNSNYNTNNNNDTLVKNDKIQIKNTLPNNKDYSTKENEKKSTNLDDDLNYDEVSLNMSFTSNITSSSNITTNNILSKNLIVEKSSITNNLNNLNPIDNKPRFTNENHQLNNFIKQNSGFSTYNLDDTWKIIILTVKEWVYKLFYVIYESINANENTNRNFELFLFYSILLIKELCYYPPMNLLDYKYNTEIHPSILYFLSDYFIILEEPSFFISNFDLLIKYTKLFQHSYKYVVIIKKVFIKYFFCLDDWSITCRKKNVNSIFSEVIPSDVHEFSDSKLLDYKSNKIFRQIIELTIDNLKADFKQDFSLISLNNKGSLLYNIFVKNKNVVSKELDGSNIMDFFTILNTCEDYSLCHLNNIAGFSIIYELGKFLFETANDNEKYYDRIYASFQDILTLLLSYCIRIFDQSENYLESNKHQTVIEKNNDYNHSFIEAAVLESLKVINLICLIDNSLVSTINMRIMQVYERIALKQSGLVFLEILQFFINNNYLMIIDLDNYISQFFKLKLKFNYKYEMLSFSTLEFLFRNRKILNDMTQVFYTYFPIILKIFATFPKYIDSKFFVLIEYMTKPNTISEMFNYILDLPSVILIIENFEC